MDPEYPESTTPCGPRTKYLRALYEAKATKQPLPKEVDFIDQTKPIQDPKPIETDPSKPIDEKPIDPKDPQPIEPEVP